MFFVTGDTVWAGKIRTVEKECSDSVMVRHFSCADTLRVNIRHEFSVSVSNRVYNFF